MGEQGKAGGRELAGATPAKSYRGDTEAGSEGDGMAEQWHKQHCTENN